MASFKNIYDTNPMDPKRLLRRTVMKVRSVTEGHERTARRAGVTIGTDCRILSSVVTTEPWLISIGDRVTVSSHVEIVTHDGSGWLVRDHRGRRYRYARVDIGSDVFIGVRAVILPGVRIGDKSIIGSGTVVTKSIPPGSVVAGSPARIVGTWEDFQARTLRWADETAMNGSTYRQRVDSVVDTDYRPWMQVD